MDTKGQHVVPRNGGWAVRKAGSERVTKNFNTRNEAIREARKIAKNQATEVYIHERNGRIKKRVPYGNNLHPPKG